MYPACARRSMWTGKGEKAAFPFLPGPLSVFPMGQGQVQLEDQGWCGDSEPPLPAFSLSAPIRGPGLHGGKEGGASPSAPDQRFFQQRTQGSSMLALASASLSPCMIVVTELLGSNGLFSILI